MYYVCSLNEFKILLNVNVNNPNSREDSASIFAWKHQYNITFRIHVRFHKTLIRIIIKNKYTSMTIYFTFIYNKVINNTQMYFILFYIVVNETFKRLCVLFIFVINHN